MKNRLTAAAIALAILASPADAGKKTIVCKDADGATTFTDVACPEESIRQGVRNAPQAQTYNGRQSIDTDLLNSDEQRNGSGTRWQWVDRPAPAGSGR